MARRDAGVELRRPGLLSPADIKTSLIEFARTRGFDNWPEQFPRQLIEGNAERAELYVVERSGEAAVRTAA